MQSFAWADAKLCVRVEPYGHRKVCPILDKIKGGKTHPTGHLAPRKFLLNPYIRSVLNVHFLCAFARAFSRRCYCVIFSRQAAKVARRYSEFILASLAPLREHNISSARTITSCEIFFSPSRQGRKNLYSLARVLIFSLDFFIILFLYSVKDELTLSLHQYIYLSYDKQS